MTMRSQNKDSLSLNLSIGGNSPDANPVGYNGSPLAAFRWRRPKPDQPLIKLIINEWRSHNQQL